MHDDTLGSDPQSVYPVVRLTFGEATKSLYTIDPTGSVRCVLIVVCGLKEVVWVERSREVGREWPSRRTPSRLPSCCPDRVTSVAHG